jgi:hypothetical protein
MEDAQQERDTKSVETNDAQNNQVMTEQEDSRSTMSCTSQSNESDTDEMDMLAHSTIKQEEYTHNDDDDDDDTPYVPNIIRTGYTRC